MYSHIVKVSLLFFFVLQSAIFAQFGQNKVQYKDFTWYYIQTDHFDIYFSQKGSALAEFTAKTAEDALSLLQQSFKYKINNRIVIIVYNSTNDFQETNVTDEYLSEGIEGFTEMFKNRMVIQFMGSYKMFRHLIHHELTHAVMNDMLYGGSVQNIISNNISLNLPTWFNEGMAEYQSLGWDIDEDMFIRDAAINDYLPDIMNLEGYLAYRGGQAVFYYIAEKYGKEKIGELVNKIKATGNLEEGLKASIGLDLKELNERWKKDIRQRYWPDIAIRRDPDDFAKRLTKKEGLGFYNTSPAMSPQGDKIAYISNKDYYFDVYIMSAIDGKVIKKIVKGNRTEDFEELNIITPGLSWSPDGKKIALSAKSGGYDVIYIIDVDTEDRITIPLELDAIKSVTWSPDGKNLAFVGHNAIQSDIYLWNLDSKVLTNLTNDIFTDNDPAWAPDSKLLYFSSDRTNNINPSTLPDTFKIYKYNYSQSNIYSINVDTKQISQVTNTKGCDETSPVVGPDGKEILFISDVNGINNIYKKRVELFPSDSAKNVTDIEPIPITNSLNGLYQLSASKDGKKLTFSTLFQSSFNIFLLTNPFEIKLDTNKIPLTIYISKLKKMGFSEGEPKKENSINSHSSKNDTLIFYSGQVTDTSKVYGDSVQIDLNNYIFGNNIKLNQGQDSTTISKFNLKDNLDSQGNFKVNKYKITFSPDIVYANAGYSSLYGLLGTTIISFSDVLGNHRLIGQTSLQIDLKNSDYGLAYFFLPDRINYGIEGFHTARFVYLTRTQTGATDLYRFRNYGGIASLSYPLNKFYRIEGGLSFLNVTKENLDDSSEPSEKVSFLVPTLSFIHDNVLWGYTSPIEGSRYRLDVLGNPGINNKKLSFYSGLLDYRTYFRFFTDYSFAFRLSGGASGGPNPQRFFIGGVENWINRSFATSEIPINSASDFAFLTAALPLRGYDYAAEIGTHYSLLNAELRFPFIRSLVTGGIPLFFSNVLGVIFLDMGTAWNDTHQLRFFERNDNGSVVSRDLLTGTGVGTRIFFLYFLLRFDVAWAYNFNQFSAPKWYISLGADF
ncbi:MAG: peptidase MA family metallohydrolase [Ignavibacteriaceae bacterium]|nr:peptidase MA family metallohydrolase [Ignavibacteriaceae bacterium]